MKSRRINLLFALSAIVLIGCAAYIAAPAHERYVIYYKTLGEPPAVSAYDLLVLQPDTNIDLASLRDNQTTLAYISIGEAVHGFISEEDSKLLTIRKHEFWDNDLIDVRHPRWHDLILNKFVAEAVEAGFDGIMLDTADSPIYLEATEPNNFQGMTKATVALIAKIHKQYPDLKIMLNRGFEIWNDAGAHIDMLLVESILSLYDLEAGEGKIAPTDYYQQQLEKIHSAQKLHPHLKVYSIDYWDMNDTKGVQHIYRTQRSNGIVPYVTKPMLDVIHTEPDDPYAFFSPLKAILGGDDA